MIEFLKDWAPIIISGLALIVGIITNYKNRKQNSEYRNRVREFETQKELIHQQRREIDETFMRLNSRSNFIPFLHLILENSKIEKITLGSTEHVKLKICLVNIGKASASNIRICPIKKNGSTYIKTRDKGDDIYIIHDYLSQCYAVPGEYVEFSVVREIERNVSVKDALDRNAFKIQFEDLLGNWYEQEFEFAFNNKENEFLLGSLSASPRFVEEHTL